MLWCEFSFHYFAVAMNFGLVIKDKRDAFMKTIWCGIHVTLTYINIFSPLVCTLIYIHIHMHTHIHKSGVKNSYGQKENKLWLIECSFFWSDFDLFIFSCWNVIQPLCKLLQTPLVSFLGGGIFNSELEGCPTWGILKCVNESLLYTFYKRLVMFVQNRGST